MVSNPVKSYKLDSSDTDKDQLSDRLSNISSGLAKNNTLLSDKFEKFSTENDKLHSDLKELTDLLRKYIEKPTPSGPDGERKSSEGTFLDNLVGNIGKSLDNLLQNLFKNFDLELTKLFQPPKEAPETGINPVTEEVTQKAVAPIAEINKNIADSSSTPTENKTTTFDLNEVIKNISNLNQTTSKLISSESPLPENLVQNATKSAASGAEGSALVASSSSGLETLLKSLPSNAAGVAAAMSSGGGTTSNMAWVGEGSDFDPSHTELMINPTGAPIHILNADQLKNLGVDIPHQGVEKHSSGTPGSESSLQEVLKGLPGFASGTRVGQGLGAVASGGNFSSPNDILGGSSYALQSVIGMIPVIGDKINAVITAFEYLGQVIIDVVEGFNKLAESLAPFSAQISQTIAESHVKEIEYKVGVAQEMGPELSQLYATSTDVWIDIKKILTSIAEPLLEVVLPIMELLKGFLNLVTPWLQAIGDVFTIIFGFIPKLFGVSEESIGEFIDRKVEDIHRRFVEPKNKNDLFQGLLSDTMDSAIRQTRFGHEAVSAGGIRFGGGIP